MLRERSSSAGTNQDQSGDEQAATVLSEFSSVVADTQQYIIQTEEAQENAVRHRMMSIYQDLLET